MRNRLRPTAVQKEGESVRDATTMELRSVASRPEHDGSTRVELSTADLPVVCRYFAASSGEAAIVWVFGAGGGWGGPAGGLYPRIGQKMVPEGVSSLEVA